MKRFLLVFFAALLALPVLPARAGDAAAPPAAVTVHDAYAFATAEGQANGAAFLVAENAGDTADSIISAASGVAGTAELHTHIMDGDVMKMRKVDAFDLPASGQLVLEPGGNHIMLMGLKKPLVEGEDFPLTLTFSKAGAVNVSVHVVKPGATPGTAMPGMKMDHDGGHVH